MLHSLKYMILTHEMGDPVEVLTEYDHCVRKQVLFLSSSETKIACGISTKVDSIFQQL